MGQMRNLAKDEEERRRKKKEEPRFKPDSNFFSFGRFQKKFKMIRGFESELNEKYSDYDQKE